MRPSWGLGLLLALFAGFLVLQGAVTGLRPRQPPGPSAPAPENDLVGRVFGPDGPVGGARVRLKGTATSERTDACGRFRLPRNPRARRVTAWKEGYPIAGARVSGVPPDPPPHPLRRTDHDRYRSV